MGEINGKKIRVYFDTGAEISIMSNDIAKQYNFKIKPSEIKLRLANNEIDDPIRETEPLDIRIDNTIVTIKFYVIKHNFHPILLGLDWFNQTGALISPGSDTPYIRMGQREVYLNQISTTVNVEEGRPDELHYEDQEEYGLDIKEIQELAEITPTIKLNEEQLKEFNKLVPLIRDRTTSGLHDIGKYTGEKMTIELDSKTPLIMPQYRVAPALQEKLDNDIDLMLKYGIIEESTGSFSNPIFAKAKTDGGIRIVHDFRALNLRIKSVQFPIPNIKETLEKLQGHQYISTIDFYKGFYHLVLRKEDREFTGFSLKDRHLHYIRCPQGIKTGPAYFSMAVAKTLRPCRKFATSYFDDVIIYSKTIEEHIEYIKEVMLKLKEADFKISGAKSNWFMSSVKFLGYIVSGSNMAIDPKKTETIETDHHRRTSSNCNHL